MYNSAPHQVFKLRNELESEFRNTVWKIQVFKKIPRSKCLGKFHVYAS